MKAQDGEGFPQAARIRRRREFLSLGRSGQKRRTDHFVLLFQRAAARPRLGITVSRKVGGAVVRNRLKRRIREVFRRHSDRACLANDVIVIAKPGIGAVAASVVRDELAIVLSARQAPRPSVGHT